MRTTIEQALEAVNNKLQHAEHYSAAQLSVLRKQKKKLKAQLLAYKQQLKTQFIQTGQLNIKL